MMNENRVIALGFFDGVHTGHKALIRACKELAREQECCASLLTFTTHPEGIVNGNAPKLINTMDLRKRLIQINGIQDVIELPFDREMMSMPWRDFFRLLREEYGARGLVCGHDFRFGRGGAGTAEALESLCRENGMKCVIVPEQRIDGITVSSTHIRACLEDARLEEANRFLGHTHCLSGQVVSGHQLGRRLGMPTANILLPEDVVCPARGVYATRVHVDGNNYFAVTNVGTRPTVNGDHITVESLLIGFDGDLYGKEIIVSFHRYLRPEHRFDSLEELRAAVKRDKDDSFYYFVEIMAQDRKIHDIF